jgi:hypothetical protein
MMSVVPCVTVPLNLEKSFAIIPAIATVGRIVQLSTLII